MRGAARFYDRSLLPGNLRWSSPPVNSLQCELFLFLSPGRRVGDFFSGWFFFLGDLCLGFLSGIQIAALSAQEPLPRVLHWTRGIISWSDAADDTQDDVHGQFLTKCIFSLMDKRKANMLQPGKRPRIDSGSIRWEILHPYKWKSPLETFIIFHCQVYKWNCSWIYL